MPAVTAAFGIRVAQGRWVIISQGFSNSLNSLRRTINGHAVLLFLVTALVSNSNAFAQSSTPAPPQPTVEEKPTYGEILFKKGPSNSRFGNFANLAISGAANQERLMFVAGVDRNTDPAWYGSFDLDGNTRGPWVDHDLEPRRFYANGDGSFVFLGVEGERVFIKTFDKNGYLQTARDVSPIETDEEKRRQTYRGSEIFTPGPQDFPTLFVARDNCINPIEYSPTETTTHDSVCVELSDEDERVGIRELSVLNGGTTILAYGVKLKAEWIHQVPTGADAEFIQRQITSRNSAIADLQKEVNENVQYQQTALTNAKNMGTKYRETYDKQVAEYGEKIQSRQQSIAVFQQANALAQKDLTEGFVRVNSLDRSHWFGFLDIKTKSWKRTVTLNYDFPDDYKHVRNWENLISSTRRDTPLSRTRATVRSNGDFLVIGSYDDHPDLLQLVVPSNQNEEAVEVNLALPSEIGVNPLLFATSDGIYAANSNEQNEPFVWRIGTEDGDPQKQRRLNGLHVSGGSNVTGLVHHAGNIYLLLRQSRNKMLLGRAAVTELQ